jgi:type VI secretion system secreted protein Hcp
MGMPLHLELTGEKQGKIEGSCDMTGREGTIFVTSLNHAVTIPYRLGGVGGQSLATGKRIHEPLTITKDLDKSSPKLYMALTTGEVITDLTLKWYRISKQGTEEHYFTTQLEDAIIVSISPSVAEGSGSHMESISFAYKKIIWTWEVDGISAEDDWSVPKE